MDVFEFRDKLIGDYASYVSSFYQIKDDGIRKTVEQNLREGLLWPEPLIQLNPAFEPGKSIEELIAEGLLSDDCGKIFRRKPEPSIDLGPLQLRKHQEDALRVAKTGANYVLTTGTGSGKSLAYILPIVDFVLRAGSGKGVRAIIVYPMNALANSQEDELKKYLCHGNPITEKYKVGKPPVTFSLYTGQNNDEERKEIIANPPDIILTNYVMLELMLTRPDERRLIDAASDCQFLVFDELHTYRGRQGADVALLCRRVSERLGNKRIQYVGTSATLAGAGTLAEQQAEVAQVASYIFGAEVKPNAVIGETLRRSTMNVEITNPRFIEDLKQRVLSDTASPAKTFNEFTADPFSIWLENTFGIEEREGRIVRAKPKSITGSGDSAAVLLSKITGAEVSVCAEKIRKWLLAGYECEKNPVTGEPPFAFRLHQFISRGDTVYASIEPEATRYITVFGQQFVPGDRSKILLPLAFCRECGQEYYSVKLTKEIMKLERKATARELKDTETDELSKAGYLYFSATNPYPNELDLTLPEHRARIPDEWLEEAGDGKFKLKPSRRHDLPVPITLDTVGKESADGLSCHFIETPFQFCLNCGVSYGSGRTDFAKLSSLSSEGRSTATTVLSLTAVRYLQTASGIKDTARKLLSFTDNRQDASLQAGHFNDFIEIAVLRAGLYKATQEAGPDGISHEDLTHKVFKSLGLPIEMFAKNEVPEFAGPREQINKAFREVLGYRLYRDQERGWRITSPNLEQCGLVEIGYSSLDELCASDKHWKDWSPSGDQKKHPCHVALSAATAKTRETICKVLLDFLRRELVINVNYLDPGYQEKIRQGSDQHLREPWNIDENERLETYRAVFPRSRTQRDRNEYVFLSARSGFGQFLRRDTTFPNYRNKLSLQEAQEICIQLLEKLKLADIVEVVYESRSDNEVAGYRLKASSMIWKPGDGTKSFHDPIRMPQRPNEGGRPNEFFVDFYRAVASSLIGLQAKEHTAQVKSEDRIKRERLFKEGALPILFCSPTMELGVDISDLNAVNMRNVPPTPANYAQRSGRAGRSGQPALVYTYCSSGSNHDQYFFRRPQLMVAGAVTPPRLDLSNEHLVEAHVHAIWLAEAGLSLGKSLKDILDLSGNNPSLELLPEAEHSIKEASRTRRAMNRARTVLSTFGEQLQRADWYTDDWLDDVIKAAPRKLNEACDRWRELYWSALNQFRVQNQLIEQAGTPPDVRKQAERLRREAVGQLDLLRQTDEIMQSDFYSYRYFASEGFLPGYNFPRLPLAAYIPGRRDRKANNRRDDGDEYVQRPRFLAISEFGPGSIIYHEGARYKVAKAILPVSREDGTLAIASAKQCDRCGYVHPIVSGDGVDLCEHCSKILPQSMTNLFRLQNVVTRRTERINSDEEERVRQGYDIRTGVRFPHSGSRRSCRTATVNVDGKPFAKLTYSDSATVWRVNFGWRRRKKDAPPGFLIDPETGAWYANPSATQADPGDATDNMRRPPQRVIPFVSDTKNCLLMEFEERLSQSAAITMQAALKTAIQVEFQLEESELAAEPLPSREDCRVLLFYEASEGGAGVLRRLLDSPDTMASVAKQGLSVCHFDPDTHKDQGQAPNSKEPCTAACYSCLMSYRNQIDHELLDRKNISEILIQLKRSVVDASPREATRADHLRQLMRLTDSTLEKEWLTFIDERGYNLPTDAQRLFEQCGTQPDFFYSETGLAVYIDGPYHDFPERQTRDKDAEDRLADYGYSVIRFPARADWEALLARYPATFGTPSKIRRERTEEASGPDFDLIASKWHALVREVHKIPGVKIEAGADVEHNGAVLGSFVVEIFKNGGSIRLLDKDSEEAKEIESALRSQNFKVITLSADDDVSENTKTIQQLLTEET